MTRIRRGDPIPSSSTPGAGMKATGSCRGIGYALEEADKNGTIQVFAHLGEHTAADVVALRTYLERLTDENRALKEQLSRWEARLAALVRSVKRPEIQ